VIANVTPGGLPTKLAALSGFHVAGTTGAVLSAVAAGLPGTLMAVAIIGFFGDLGQDAIRWVEHAAVGISAFIILLLVGQEWEPALPSMNAIQVILVSLVVIAGVIALRRPTPLPSWR